MAGEITRRRTLQRELTGTKAGHRYVVEEWRDPRLSWAAGEIYAMPADAFARYDNPFEQKWAAQDKFALPPNLAALVRELELDVDRVADMFNAPLFVDTARHYCGVFRYLRGDKLDVHVDAGTQPATGYRKHVTAVMYLGLARGGPLELWGGDPADMPYPEIRHRLTEIAPAHGRLVLFENNDYAWHGMATYMDWEPRLVVTVSYLSTAVDAFGNKRQRAYFVPRPDEQWDAARRDLRDKRADPNHYADVYRTAEEPARTM